MQLTRMLLFAMLVQAMHEFIKGDPRLPRLATDTVAGDGGTMNVIRVRIAGEGEVRGVREQGVASRQA